MSVYETPGLAALWDRGFGQVSVDALINFTDIMSLEGPIVMVLIANLPQLILSLLYTALNGMWTAMLVGVEWNTYGQEHKGLRTSSPVGSQRRTYWLSLPLVSSAFLLEFMLRADHRMTWINRDMDCLFLPGLQHCTG